MKSLRTLGILFVLLMAGATQSLAYFDSQSLIQVVYNAKTSIEFATDLGTIGSSTLPSDYQGGSNLTLASAGTITTSLFGATSWSDLSVGYFGYDSSTKTYYFASTAATAPGANYNQRQNYFNTWDVVAGNYNSYGTQSVLFDTTDSSSYYYSMDQFGNAPGSYANLTRSQATGESVLTALATTGYTDMYLYAYTFNTTTQSAVLQSGPDASSPYIAILRLYADGSTALLAAEPSAVPIPASLLLFGSGLLGFFGLKRKDIVIAA